MLTLDRHPFEPEQDASLESPLPLGTVLDRLLAAATKLRLAVWRDDGRNRARMIRAAVETLRAEHAVLLQSHDLVDRGVLADEMAELADGIASSASEIGGDDDSLLEDRAAVDVAHQATRLAHALRSFVSTPSFALQ